jgi:hypothetical protein
MASSARFAAGLHVVASANAQSVKVLEMSAHRLPDITDGVAA